MLYTKAITEISWEDIVEFCNQRTPEGACLDYKRDFPKNLEKTIAAMANTLGGIILLGVAEDDQTKPVFPLEGIPFQRGLSERVTNIILTNITPPIFPEIQPYRNSDDKSKAIVLIRIPQSHQTPHAISNNTKVYIRTGNRNNPEALADLDRIGWLVNQRQKSESLRALLYKEADQRFVNLYARALAQSQKGDSEIHQMVSQGKLTLSLCPVYPKDAFCTPPDLDTIAKKIRVRDYYGTGDFFPLPDRIASLIVQNGVVLRFFNDNEFYYTELNCFGLYFYRESFRRLNPSQVEKPIILAGETVSRADQFIDSGIKYYEELGYWGMLLFRVHLDNILEYILNPDLQILFRITPLFSPDNEVQFTDIILAGSLGKEKEHLTFESIRRIGWAFDWNITPPLLNAFFNRIKR